MSTPSSTFTEMVSTTLRQHNKEMADSVSKHNALWNRLDKKKLIEKIDGGYEIVEPIMYAENSTYQRYSGFELLNINQSDVITSAKFDWKQSVVNIVASGLELRNNSGKNAMIKLAKAKMKVAKQTFSNNINADLHSDGTADGGKQIGGLEALLTSDGTGTYGGINAGNFTFWKNQFQDGNTATSATIRGKMKALWLATCRGTDKTDLIISSTDLFSLYWDSLTDLQRFTQADEADTGFDSIKFMSADVVHETSESGISANRMNFLNTDYLKLVVHKDAFMTVADEKSSANQDGVVIPILFQGNLVCSNRARQGLLFD
ncbi:MAG: phage major capsid protein [Gammaproteobacteria bacterium]|nr:phage major capsid protein [Gammaproteobacteria bacterium]